MLQLADAVVALKTVAAQILTLIETKLAVKLQSYDR
jgi:hypothetical protein